MDIIDRFPQWNNCLTMYRNKNCNRICFLKSHKQNRVFFYDSNCTKKKHLSWNWWIGLEMTPGSIWGANHSRWADDWASLGILCLIKIFLQLLQGGGGACKSPNCVAAGTTCPQHNENNSVWRPLWSFHPAVWELASWGSLLHTCQRQGKTYHPHTRGLLRGPWVNWKTYMALSQLVSFHCCKIACLLIWISTQGK